jgi:hypothetical protein
VVLGPLIVGIIMILAFPAREVWRTKQPMAPARIFHGQRVVALALVFVFVAGMNFYSILGFFLISLEDFYDSSPVQIGLRSLYYPITILEGAYIVNFAFAYTKGHV